MNLSTPYHPINCTFHDRLEHWSIRREEVVLEYLDQGELRSLTVVIADVRAENGADWAVLEPGTEHEPFTIRLDQIHSVNGHVLNHTAC